MALEFPVPSEGDVVVVAPAPGSGPGFWSGAPSAALDTDGTLVVAYRVRVPDQRGSNIVIARTADGQHLTTVASLTKERFDAESLERPALVRTDDGWRLYVSCATPGSKHWRIDALDATEPAAFGTSEPYTVFAGDKQVGVKDPVIRRRNGKWLAWICCHPLDPAGEEDRMTTAYATSDDGINWLWRGVVLSGRAGMWDARGARVTAVLPDGRASYDGRATKEENFSERTGIARLTGQGGLLVAMNDAPVSNARYLDVVPLPGGGYQLLFEMPRADGSHDLCTERIP
ncbi:MAG TPA: hypothetical protein VM674_02715 [Candidatus Acidoferrum sp.]|nr:hypothetical protein [Candidatus Acidoferrum sp.]